MLPIRSGIVHDSAAGAAVAAGTVGTRAAVLGAGANVGAGVAVIDRSVVTVTVSADCAGLEHPVTIPDSCGDRAVHPCFPMHGMLTARPTISAGSARLPP